MNILITKPKGTQTKYRIDYGHGGLMWADTEEQAVCFAGGIEAGWEAARLSLEKCHGYHFARETAA